jgi:site-specific recombinase XerC
VSQIELCPNRRPLGFHDLRCRAWGWWWSRRLGTGHWRIRLDGPQCFDLSFNQPALQVVLTGSPSLFPLLGEDLYRVIARVGDRKTGPRPREKRFPSGTALRVMRRWQEDTRADLRRENLRPVLGSLAADVERYLNRIEVKKLVSSKARASDTNAWLMGLGHLRRDEISAENIQQQTDGWLKAGVKAWTVRHRINALRQLYKILDGEGGYNPVLEVRSPAKPRAIPRALDYDTIRTVFNQMAPTATKGFLMIMAFCGFRPEEIRRTEPWMVHLDADPPNVIRNTAKGGDVAVVPLSSEGVLGWRMFTDHGGSDRQPEAKDRRGRPLRTRTFPNANRDWKAAMSRGGFAPTRCYDLVHSYCTQLLQFGGGDISLVQKARGHRDIRTTLIYTQVVVDPRLDEAVQKAFAMRPKAPLSVAGSRGSNGK